MQKQSVLKKVVAAVNKNLVVGNSEVKWQAKLAA